MQEINDDKESAKLNSEIKSFFSGYGNTKLSLNQLRQIKKIIGT